MAELTAPLHEPGSSGAKPGLATQLRAVAWLRWRIFANGFRRKGGVGEIIGRVILYPILAAFLLGPSLGIAAASFYCVSSGVLDRLAWVTWIAFGLTQLVNINLGQPGTTFDPTDLIRFPVPLRDYVVLRLFFGLLSPGNLMMVCVSAAAALGVTLARPALWWAACLAMAIFALTNVLFTRMIFSWVDRWLSTRRARELFTAFIFVFSLGIQWVNATFNPGFQQRHARHISPERVALATRWMARVQPFAAVLPPGLTGSSLVAAAEGRIPAALGYVLGCALFGVLFLGVFALRMRVEFGGENLSDTANAVKHRPAPAAVSMASHHHAAAVQTEASAAGSLARPEFAGTLGAIVGKELLTLRRNVGLFYGMIAPVVMVFLFAGRLSMHGTSHWILPTAAAYALLGIVPMGFNSFGLEGTGAQLYFMAPIRMRDVFLAKNLMVFLMGGFELAVVVGVVAYVVRSPDLTTLFVVILWAIGTMAFATCVGNFMSVSSPKKINPGRAANRQAAPLSALLAMGILLVTAAIGGAAMVLGEMFSLPWLPMATAVVLAAGGIATYWGTLGAAERFAMDHRESLFEEMGKKA